MTAAALEALRSTLAREAHVRVVAAGKAAVGMAQAFEDEFGTRIDAGLMTADVDAGLSGRWRAVAATHPRPGAGSEEAGRAALALADRCRIDGGLLVVGLSGGASAMLAVPGDGLTVADKAETTRLLLAAGLDIGAVNLVRRHLSAVKGGQLAARAGRSVTLAISDVCTPVEDDPRVIGSGPTVGDDSTFGEALAVIERAGLTDHLPAAVRRHLEAGAAGQTTGPVPPGDPRLRQSAYWIVASRQDAMRAASATAARLGYRVEQRQPPVVGEARLAAAGLIRTAAGLSRPACLVSSGETTVHVHGVGVGGRNQELALAAVEALGPYGGAAALASLGTDGVDGPTDAAGAFVDGSVWTALGPEAPHRIRAALERNDAYPILDSLGCLIRTGPTGTNVGDLQVVLIDGAPNPPDRRPTPAGGQKPE